MSHWTRPPDSAELRELQRETSPAAGPQRRWYAVVFVVGALTAALLGFTTNFFDGGPTRSDVNQAYRVAFDEETAQADARWAAELESRWWEAYKQGRSEGPSAGPTLAEAIRQGFSYDGGYEAGLQSPEVDLDDAYRRGWMQGFSIGWSSVTGDPAPATPSTRISRLADRADRAGRAVSVEWGGEP